MHEFSRAASVIIRARPRCPPASAQHLEDAFSGAREETLCAELQTDEEARFGHAPSIARHHFVFSLLRLSAAVARASRAAAAEIADAGGVEYASRALQEVQRAALEQAAEETRLRDGVGLTVVVTAEGIASATAPPPPPPERKGSGGLGGSRMGVALERLFPPTLEEHHLTHPRTGPWTGNDAVGHGEDSTEQEGELKGEEEPQEKGLPTGLPTAQHEDTQAARAGNDDPTIAEASAQRGGSHKGDSAAAADAHPTDGQPASSAAEAAPAAPGPLEEGVSRWWLLWAHAAAVVRALKPRPARMKYALKVAAVRLPAAANRNSPPACTSALQRRSPPVNSISYHFHLRCAAADPTIEHTLAASADHHGRGLCREREPE